MRLGGKAVRQEACELMDKADKAWRNDATDRRQVPHEPMTRTRHSKRKGSQPFRGPARQLESDHPSHRDPHDVNLLVLRPSHPVEKAESVPSHVGRSIRPWSPRCGPASAPVVEYEDLVGRVGAEEVYLKGKGKG
jgi:hypothetical protein